MANGRMDNLPQSGISPAVMRDSDFSDIVIVGGGLNGNSLALALAQAGLSVTLVDALAAAPRTDGEFDGRAYALALASQRLLSAIGVWDLLADRSQPILEVAVSDGRPGDGLGGRELNFDHAEIEEGPMGFMVEDRHLRRALMDSAAAEPLIATIDGAAATGHEIAPGSATVELSNGQAVSGRLLVGADGRGSGVAQRAGIRRKYRDYGQTSLVCAIAHERPHRGVARQIFLPSGPLALLPLAGNRSSIVWTERRETAERIHALDDQGYLAEFRSRIGNLLGEIELAGSRFAHPLAYSAAISSTANRIALVGDAAQAVHPVAGQGLNAGLRDAATLAQVLVEANRRGEDFAAANVLDRYESWRRLDRLTLALSTDAFNRVFSSDNAFLRGARGLGIGLVAALPGLKRAFIREATGLLGDVPDLLRGQGFRAAG